MSKRRSDRFLALDRARGRRLILEARAARAAQAAAPETGLAANDDLAAPDLLASPPRERSAL
jgi:hypothetical protein